MLGVDSMFKDIFSIQSHFESLSQYPELITSFQVDLTSGSNINESSHVSVKVHTMSKAIKSGDVDY